MPFSRPGHPDIPNARYVIFPRFPYLAFYTVKGDDIVVVSVEYATRDYVERVAKRTAAAKVISRGRSRHCRSTAPRSGRSSPSRCGLLDSRAFAELTPAARFAGDLRWCAMRRSTILRVTDDVIVEHGVIDSAVSFIEKPLTPDRLATKVREVLDG